MIASISPGVACSIRSHVANKMLEFYPAQLPPEVALKAPDLVNRTPVGDLSLTNTGSLVQAEVAPQDIANRSGAPSPGIWILFMPIQILSIITLGLSAAAVLVLASKVPLFYHALIDNFPWVTAILCLLLMGLLPRFLPAAIFKLAIVALAVFFVGAAWWDLTAYYYRLAFAMDAVVILPALLLSGLMLLVVTERENSESLGTLLQVGGVAKILLPLVWVLRLYGSHGTKGGWIWKIAAGLALILTIPIILPITTALTAIAGMFLHHLLLKAYRAGRAKTMRDASRDSRLAALRKDIDAYKHTLETQMAEAARDNSGFISLGMSKGILRRDGDMLTPDEEGVIGLSVRDMFTGLWIFGKTGSGKTASVIRSVVYQWRQKRLGGMLLLDGKGALPLEMMPHLDHVIDPFRAHINPIEGVSPEIAASTMRSVCVSGEADKDIWASAAEGMVKQALFVVQAMAASGVTDVKYCVRDLHRFCLTESYRAQVLFEFFDGGITAKNGQPPMAAEKKGYPLNEDGRKRLEAMPSYMRLAFEYFLSVYWTLPSDTRGSVTFTVDNWLANVTSHSIMQRWAGHESDIDVVDAIVHGKMIGASAPSETCGSGGALGLALLKASLLQRLLSRGSNPHWEQQGETPVLIVADEVSALLDVGGSDANAASKLRSLKAGLVYATQNIGQIEQKLTEKGAEALLSCFSSYITFRSTSQTLQYVSKQAGTRHRTITDKQVCDIGNVMQSTTALNAASSGGTGQVGTLIDSATDSIVSLRKQFSIGTAGADQDTIVRKESTLKGTYECIQTSTADELDMYLSEPRVAYFSLNRAGGPRREYGTFDFDPQHPMHQVPSQHELDRNLITGDQYVGEALQSNEALALECRAFLQNIPAILAQASSDMDFLVASVDR